MSPLVTDGNLITLIGLSGFAAGVLQNATWSAIQKIHDIFTIQDIDSEKLYTNAVLKALKDHSANYDEIANKNIKIIKTAINKDPNKLCIATNGLYKISPQEVIYLVNNNSFRKELSEAIISTYNLSSYKVHKDIFIAILSDAIRFFRAGLIKTLSERDILLLIFDSLTDIHTIKIGIDKILIELDTIASKNNSEKQYTKSLNALNKRITENMKKDGGKFVETKEFEKIIPFNKVEVLTKYMPTEPRDAIERDNLIKFLENNLSKRIMVVEAPAGYGKTILLSQFFKRNATNCLWCNIETSDGNVLNLFRSVVEGIKTKYPDFGSDTDNFLKEISDFSDISQMLATYICFELGNSVKVQFYIIFEDFYHIHNRKDANSFFDNLITCLPSNIKLILTTRITPWYIEQKWEKGSEIFYIDKTQLQFSKDDLERYLDSFSDHTHSDSEIENLLNITEGWPLCIALANDVAQQRGKSATALDILKEHKGPIGTISIFLINEFIEQLNIEETNVLYLSGILIRINADACDKALGINNSSDILTSIRNKSSLLLKITEKWYRLHNMFREFLNLKIDSLEKETGISIKTIHLRLAEYYEKNNLIIEALHHYNLSQYTEKAAQVLNKIIKDVHSREAVLKERKWVFDIPTNALKEHPWLLIYKGRISEYSGDYKKANSSYRAALKIMTDISDNYGIMMAHYYIAKILQLTKVGNPIDNLECAKNYAKTLKDNFMYSLILRKIASENRIRGDFNNAMSNLNEAVKINTSIKNEIGLSLCFHTMGNFIVV